MITPKRGDLCNLSLGSTTLIIPTVADVFTIASLNTSPNDRAILSCDYHALLSVLLLIARISYERLSDTERETFDKIATLMFKPDDNMDELWDLYSRIIENQDIKTSGYKKSELMTITFLL